MWQWLQSQINRYRGLMSPSSVPRRAVAPLPRPQLLETYDGLWVALDGEDVIAAAETSHALALHLHALDHRIRARAVVEYVRPASESYIVGVG
jgi:hypothetical protein